MKSSITMRESVALFYPTAMHREQKKFFWLSLKSGDTKMIGDFKIKQTISISTQINSLEVWIFFSIMHGSYVNLQYLFLPTHRKCSIFSPCARSNEAEGNLNDDQCSLIDSLVITGLIFTFFVFFLFSNFVFKNKNLLTFLILFS